MFYNWPILDNTIVIFIISIGLGSNPAGIEFSGSAGNKIWLRVWAALGELNEQTQSTTH